MKKLQAKTNYYYVTIDSIWGNSINCSHESFSITYFDESALFQLLTKRIDEKIAELKKNSFEGTQFKVSLISKLN